MHRIVKKRVLVGGKVVIIPYKAVGGMGLQPVKRTIVNGKRHFTLPYRDPSHHSTMKQKQTKTAQEKISEQMARVRII